jgi:hypothetical protein
VASAHEDFLAGSADSTAPAPPPRQASAPSDGSDWVGQDGMDEEDLF